MGKKKEWEAAPRRGGMQLDLGDVRALRAARAKELEEEEAAERKAAAASSVQVEEDMIGAFMSDIAGLASDGEEEALSTAAAAGNGGAVVVGGGGISDWVECVDTATGQVYYWNQKNDMTRWDNPFPSTSTTTTPSPAPVSTEATKVEPRPASYVASTSSSLSAELAKAGPPPGTLKKKNAQALLQQMPPAKEPEQQQRSVQEQQALDEAAPWAVAIDEATGGEYYWHVITGETTWTKPEPHLLQPRDDEQVAEHVTVFPFEDDEDEDEGEGAYPFVTIVNASRGHGSTSRSSKSGSREGRRPTSGSDDDEKGEEDSRYSRRTSSHKRERSKDAHRERGGTQKTTVAVADKLAPVVDALAAGLHSRLKKVEKDCVAEAGEGALSPLNVPQQNWDKFKWELELRLADWKEGGTDSLFVMGKLQKMAGRVNGLEEELKKGFALVKEQMKEKAAVQELQDKDTKRKTQIDILRNIQEHIAASTLPVVSASPHAAATSTLPPTLPAGPAYSSILPAAAAPVLPTELYKRKRERPPEDDGADEEEQSCASYFGLGDFNNQDHLTTMDKRKATKKKSSKPKLGPMAPLVAKWQTVQKTEEEDEPVQLFGEERRMFEAQQEKIKHAKWQADHVNSGLAEQNANFVPVSDDWRKRIALKNKQKLDKMDN